MQKEYFLDLKHFPVSDGVLSLSQFSSGALRVLMNTVSKNGDPLPFAKLKNLNELVEKIDYELDRFKEAKSGPPAFLQYLADLREIRPILSKAMDIAVTTAVSSVVQQQERLDEDLDYSSPQYVHRENFPKLKDHKAALDRIRRALDEEVEEFITQDSYNFGETMVLHFKLLSEFARIDFLQKGDEEIIAVETGFVEQPVKEELKEVALAPNHFKIEVHDLETYVIYERTKDAMAAIAAKIGDGVRIPVEPLTSNRKISDKVVKLIELERAILERNILTKDLGFFNWYSVKSCYSKPSVLWNRPANRLRGRLPLAFMHEQDGEHRHPIKERRKSFLSLRKGKA